MLGIIQIPNTLTGIGQKLTGEFRVVDWCAKEKAVDKVNNVEKEISCN
ncbi:MAG: hypothetical protein QXH07_04870 [Thermoplasmata archaeon]